jgi:hypothetical protein
MTIDQSEPEPPEKATEAASSAAEGVDRTWRPPVLTTLGGVDALTDIGGSAGPDGETSS